MTETSGGMGATGTGPDWADPSALGLAALAGINLAFAGEFLGWWGAHAGPLVAAVGFVGGICQLATGLISLRQGDGPSGTLMATFGMLFMWGPGLMLVLEATGVAGGLLPFFGAWTLFLGVILGMWSVALLRKPWFEFLIGPVGGATLASAGIADLGYLPEIVPGIGFIALLVWGLYMLLHALAATAELSVPLGRPTIELIGGFSGEASRTSTRRSHGD